MFTLKTHVVVIGSGPAGLMAALTAAGQGAKVTLLEALPSMGRKLLASGAGKCNFTNMLSAETMAERFPPEQRRFVRPALLNFTPDNCRKFFVDNEVDYKLVDDFYCFPISEKAADILNVFLKKLNEYNVKTVCDAPVEAIENQGGFIKSVTAGSVRYECDHLIVAGGGPGYPKLGGGRILDEIFKDMQIVVNKRYPALCGIKSKDLWLQDLAGIVLDKVRISLDKKNYTVGTLLFTGNGISGPAALDISGRAAKLLDEKQFVELQINLGGDRSREYWLEKLKKSRQINGKKLLRNVLAGEFPQALLNNIIKYAGAGEVTASQLNRNTEEKLIEAFTAMPCTVCAVENWEKAMASTGGISRSAVNSKTMQCKSIGNLYFAGEFIDVDGPCGGYNIQWALSSGCLAGKLLS